MSSADASIRIGIATVLSNIVSIAGTSIGEYFFVQTEIHHQFKTLPFSVFSI